MRDFWIVFWYTLKGSNAFPMRGRRGGALPILVSSVFFVLVFGLPIYVVNFESIRLLSSYGIQDLVYLNVGFWSFSISILSISSFVPFLMFNLYRSEETEYLFTLPVSRFQIVWLFTITSLISNTMMPVAYIFGLMGYAKAVGRSVAMSLLLSGLNVVFTISVSVLIASALSRVVKSNLRRLNIYIFFIDLIILVVMLQFNPATLGRERFTELIRKLEFLKSVLTSRANPFFWPVAGLEDPVFVVVISFATALIFLLIHLVSKRLSFSSLTHGGLSVRRTSFGIFGKDLKIAGRKEQFFFFLAYPVIFSVLYGFFTGDPSVMVSINCVFSVFYTSVMGAALMQSEYEVAPLFRTLPVKDFKVILPKISIPVVLYVPVSSVVVLSAVMMGFDPVEAFKVIAFMGLAFLFSSVAGVREFMRNPTHGRTVLPVTSVFKVEILSVGLVITSVVYRLTFDRSRLLYVKVLGFKLALFLREYGMILGAVFAVVLTVLWIFEISKSIGSSDF